MRYYILTILIAGLFLPAAAQAETQSSPNYTINAGRIGGGGAAADGSGMSITGIAIGQWVFIPADGVSSPAYTIKTATIATPLLEDSHSGDINGDGRVDIVDALLALRSTVGLTLLSATEVLRGDAGPLLNHVPVGDGRIDILDALLILRKSVGLSW